MALPIFKQFSTSWEAQKSNTHAIINSLTAARTTFKQFSTTGPVPMTTFMQLSTVGVAPCQYSSNSQLPRTTFIQFSTGPKQGL